MCVCLHKSNESINNNNKQKVAKADCVIRPGKLKK